MMDNTKTINVTFEKKEMIPMYELKVTKHWTWEKMIIESISFYIDNHPIEVGE